MKNGENDLILTESLKFTLYNSKVRQELESNTIFDIEIPEIAVMISDEDIRFILKLLDTLKGPDQA